MRAAVILLAGGDGRRVGGETNKVLLPLAGLPVFAWSLRWICAVTSELSAVTVASSRPTAKATVAPSWPTAKATVVLVVRPQDRDTVAKVLADEFAGHDIALVIGGATRHESEWNALTTLADRIDSADIDVVAIHDAARPLAGPDLLRSVIAAATQHGGALPVREQPRLVPRDAPAPGGRSASSPEATSRDRPGPTPRSMPGSTPTSMSGNRLVSVQTPQAFQAAPLLDAYRQAERDGFGGTDTASCVERYTDLRIQPVPCSATNLKITYPEDVALAERLLDGLAWT